MFDGGLYDRVQGLASLSDSVLQKSNIKQFNRNRIPQSCPKRRKIQKKEKRKADKKGKALTKNFINSFNIIQISPHNRSNLMRTNIHILTRIDGRRRRAAIVAGAGVCDEGVPAAADDDVAAR